MSNQSKQKIKELFNVEKGSLQSLKSLEGKYDFITASKDWKKHNSFTHDCEALVFAMGAGGSLGRTHYVDGKFIASDLCFILTPKKESQNRVNLKFYYIYFNYVRNELVHELAKGMAKKAINKTDFSNYEILYIPTTEQNKLVNKFGKIMRECDELEESLRDIINNIKYLKKVVLDKIFK